MIESSLPDQARDRAIATPSREEALRDIAEGIAAVSGRRRCAVARRVHHSGISLGHLQVLWILQDHGPLPVSRLADWLGIGVPNATGLLDRMEQRGLVERERDADDRRVVLARMTDAGRAAITEHDGWRTELIEQLLEPLATEQVLAIAGALARIRSEAAAMPASEPTLSPVPKSAPGPTLSPEPQRHEPAANDPTNGHHPADSASVRGDPLRGVPAR